MRADEALEKSRQYGLQFSVFLPSSVEPGDWDYLFVDPVDVNLPRWKAAVTYLMFLWMASAPHLSKAEGDLMFTKAALMLCQQRVSEPDIFTAIRSVNPALAAR